MSTAKSTRRQALERTPFAFIAGAILLSALILPLHLQAETNGDSSASQAREIQAAIIQLESDDFEIREAATRRLIFTGKSAMAEVAKSAVEGEPETRIRSLTILEQILLKGNQESSVPSLDALEKLQSSNRLEIKHRVDTMFANHRDHVEKAILQHFESLGGKIQRHGAVTSTQRGLFDRVFAPSELTLLIGGEFKGTQADLLRLRNVRFNAILHRSTVKIDDETQQVLLQSNPHLVIAQRDVYLGIRFGGSGQGVVITDVTPNSSASDAGLLPGDEIITYDSIELTKGESFTDYLQSKNAGYKLKLGIIRKGNPQVIVATLKEL